MFIKGFKKEENLMLYGQFFVYKRNTLTLNMQQSEIHDPKRVRATLKRKIFS